MCGSEVEGFGFDGDVLDRLKGEELKRARTYVAGHECSACGDVICVTCKKEQVGEHDIVGSCPTCGNPWAAKRTFFRPYMEQANRDTFHKLFKYDKQHREKTLSSWPGVLQILGGAVLVAFISFGLHRAATTEPEASKKLVSSGVFWLLTGVGLLLNGFAQFVPPTSAFRAVCGTALIVVGMAFPVRAVYDSIQSLGRANLTGTVVFTMAFCTVGIRHILAHRRHRSEDGTASENAGFTSSAR